MTQNLVNQIESYTVRKFFTLYFCSTCYTENKKQEDNIKVAENEMENISNSLLYMQTVWKYRVANFWFMTTNVVKFRKKS